MPADFAAIAIALWVGHQVGDHWVQSDVDAQGKGRPGQEGRLHCMAHVSSYLFTQLICVALVSLVGATVSGWGLLAGLLVSGITHYIADRRTPLIKLAGLIPGKSNFVRLGMPREGVEISQMVLGCDSCQDTGYSGDEAVPGGRCWDCRGTGMTHSTIGDNPSLGTGLYALDQAWHIFWGVFVTAIVMTVL